MAAPPNNLPVISDHFTSDSASCANENMAGWEEEEVSESFSSCLGIYVWACSPRSSSHRAVDLRTNRSLAPAHYNLYTLQRLVISHDSSYF